MAAREHWWNKYSSLVQMLAAVLGMVVVAWGITITAVTGWADERYVLKGELKTAIEDLGKQLDEAGRQRTKINLETQINDLADDIIWFDEQGQEQSALRRCRKLTRHVREWNELTGERWEQDPVVRRVCGGSQ